MSSSFAWEALGAILEGSSALELSRMAVADRAGAREFLRHYGIDLENEKDAADLRAIHQEAVSFVRRHFLDAPERGEARLEIPAEVARLDDPADLLVTASHPERGPVASWACALLRVMHTIHHANRSFRRDSMEDIRRQVFEPYRDCLQVDELGCPVLIRGDDRVQLEGVFFKEEKSRDSLLMKLLHKPGNVAQDIYDWIGIQFVTRTRLDAALVLRFLHWHHLVIFANVVPGRSVNTLIDLPALRAAYETLQARYEAAHDERQVELLERLDPELRDFSQLADALQEPPGRAPSLRSRGRQRHAPVRFASRRSENPFSSPEYRSIQFTCRQLIRAPNPAWSPVESILGHLRQILDEPQVDELVSHLDRAPMEQETAFFFPYEIQIVDYENYLKTRSGQSSHGAYKKRQVQAARRRVLHGII